METKSPLKSKTLWTALTVAICAFIPPVSEFIKANPETFATMIGVLFTGLRLITKGKVVIE